MGVVFNTRARLSFSLRLSTAEFDSFIRGYHVYEVSSRRTLREPTNTIDITAVVVFHFFLDFISQFLMMLFLSI